MVLPAGRYPSVDGQNAIEARADIYIIAAMEKKNGRPESLPNPSCVDYPYTNLYVYNQIQVLTFTLNSSDYIYPLRSGTERRLQFRDLRYLSEDGRTWTV